MRILRTLPAALLAAAAALAQQAPSPSDIHIVPFSHLDLFWGGTNEECLSRGTRIVTRAIQLAEQHPEFRFLIEDEVFTANFVDAYAGSPELDALKKLVKAGRIEIAPKWAAIYQNLPRGEALIRNLVYGKQYARSVFGVDPQVAALNDIPGFTLQYPQMLRKSGIPYMVMTRMGPADKSLFRWKAQDGSSVLVWNTVDGYSWGVNLGLHRDLDEAHLKRIASEIKAIQGTTAGGPVYVSWGSDLWAPNEKLVENIPVLNQRLAPNHFFFSTPTEYFTAAMKDAKVPVLAGEIPSSWANIITSIGHLWPPVMTAADTLINAEKFAAINYALGYAPYPKKQLDGLWKHALEAMDHNNYGQGGEIGDGRKLGFAKTATLEGGQILRESLRNLAERVEQPFPISTPIVVFNPLSWTRDDVVRAHVSLYGDAQPGALGDYRKALRLVDEKGTSIPFHVIEYSEIISRALDVVFVARAVPSLGYKTYYLVPAEKEDVFPKTTTVTLDSDEDVHQPRRVPGVNVMENEFYRVTVDRATGLIGVFDKELNRPVAPNLGMEASEERGGNPLFLEPRTGRTVVNVIHAVDLEEANPVRTVMRIEGSIADIPVTQRVTLYRGLKRVDLEDAVDWKPGRFMKIEQVVPLEQPHAEVRTGVPFGSVGEADLMPGAAPHYGDEVPVEIWKGWRQIQDWVSAGTKDWTLTMSADHQFLTVTDTAIRAGLIRGTRFNPVNVVHEGQPFLVQQPPADTYVFRYSFTSGAGDWAANRSWRSGMASNTPLIPASSVNELAKKTLPPERSFASLHGENLVVSTVKEADDGAGLVMRVFDELGQSAETPVMFLGEESSFRPANMLEEAQAGKDLTVLHVGPHEITTIRIPVR
jgi:hypothetical protein